MYPDDVAGGDEGEFVVISVLLGQTSGRTLTEGDGTAGVQPTSRARRRLNGSRTGHGNSPTGRRRPRWSLALQTAASESSCSDATGLLTLSDTRSVEGELGVIRDCRALAVTASRRFASCQQGCRRRGPRVRAAGSPPLRFDRYGTRTSECQAGYTLSSARVADALIAAQRRGATVRVLLEGEPVGSRTAAEATLPPTADAVPSVPVPYRGKHPIRPEPPKRAGRRADRAEPPARRQRQPRLGGGHGTAAGRRWVEPDFRPIRWQTRSLARVPSERQFERTALRPGRIPPNPGEPVVV